MNGDEIDRVLFLAFLILFEAMIILALGVTQGGAWLSLIASMGRHDDSPVSLKFQVIDWALICFFVAQTYFLNKLFKKP